MCRHYLDDLRDAFSSPLLTQEAARSMESVSLSLKTPLRNWPLAPCGNKQLSSRVPFPRDRWTPNKLFLRQSNIRFALTVGRPVERPEGLQLALPSDARSHS